MWYNIYKRYEYNIIKKRLRKKQTENATAHQNVYARYCNKGGVILNWRAQAPDKRSFVLYLLKKKFKYYPRPDFDIDRYPMS